MIIIILFAALSHISIFAFYADGFSTGYIGKPLFLRLSSLVIMNLLCIYKFSLIVQQYYTKFILFSL